MTQPRMSKVASIAWYQTLRSIQAVVDTVDDRILNRLWLSADYTYPALIHYSEPGGLGYGKEINSESLPNTVSLRYVSRLLCEGESTSEIDEAADAILARMSYPLVAPAGFMVTAMAVEPWPQVAVPTGDGGVSYSETGDYYIVEVMRMGV